jgi:Na+:H+ antiporter
MNVGTTLLDILVVLLAAKAAAELAERAGVPAVVGEIVAGVLIGPSAFNLVHSSDVLQTLGELGVILLLLEVGMSMRLSELAAVGRASTLVAVVGVVVPTFGGLGVALAFGHDFNVSLFLGAALAATSVGITARVFSDLRALAMVEARTVLGAAVADDVLGLVILTVVVRLATGSSVSLAGVLGIVGIAIAFLVATTIAGQWIGPGLFAFVDRFSRSAGTMVAIAFAFTLAFAKLADAAQLAPIVGAFVAGVSLSGSSQRERIQRELRPVGHLFIPVFFLEIGIEANIQAFVRPQVIGIAAALFVVAVIGKLLSPIGAIGSPGDKRLIGLGMIPRGEVGLIFASIGIQDHVLSHDLYASLLLVVLVTTVVTPPLLRWRLQQLRHGRGDARGEVPRPSGGWLRRQDGTVILAAHPPSRLALHVGLEAALALVDSRPSPGLLDWFGVLDPEQTLHWDDDATTLLFRVLLEGNERSWRFLATSGLLERSLPELAEPLSKRQSDPFELDPTQILRFALVDRIRHLTGTDRRVARDWQALKHPEWLLLAALVIDTASEEAPVVLARRLVKRLNLGASAEEEIALLVGQHGLLRGAAENISWLEEETVLQLATRLQTPERTLALAVLSAAINNWTRADRERFDTLVELILRTIADPSLTGREASNTNEARRLQAMARVGEHSSAAKRIRHAPRAYVLSQAVPDLVRHAQLFEPMPRPNHPRVHVHDLESQGEYEVEVAARDRARLLTTVAGVLADHRLDVRRATATTWPDSAALEVFFVRTLAGDTDRSPDAVSLERAISRAFGSPLESSPVPDAVITFDDSASPWYTLCEVRAEDRPGFLHDVTAAFAAADASIHSAQVSMEETEVVDHFELTDHQGRKLSNIAQASVREAVGNGVRLDRRSARQGRPWTLLRRMVRQ